MRKNKSIIAIIVITVIFLLASLSIFLLLSNVPTPEISKMTTVEILSVGNAEESDFQRYNNAFNLENVEFKVDDFRLLKVHCRIENNNDFAVNIMYSYDFRDSDFILKKHSIDIEPTYPISAHNEQDFDFYIYANENITEEQAFDMLSNRFNHSNELFYIVREAAEGDIKIA